MTDKPVSDFDFDQPDERAWSRGADHRAYGWGDGTMGPCPSLRWSERAIYFYQLGYSGKPMAADWPGEPRGDKVTYKFNPKITPQKARGKFDESLFTDNNWIAEEKYDGDRRIAQFVNSTVRFTGTPSKKTGEPVERTDNVPHLSDPLWKELQDRSSDAFYKAVNALEGTVLDGEMVVDPAGGPYPGGKSKYLTSIMGSKPEEAIRKQKERGWLRYVVFDCLFYKGRDVRDCALIDRKVWAAEAVSEWGNKHATISHTLVGPAKQKLWDRVVREGGEGVVFKHRQHTYGDEKLWVKHKIKHTADVVIMGFEPGKGKFTGSAGAIIFGQYGVPDTFGLRTVAAPLVQVGSCSGMTDALRTQFSKNPTFYTGAIIEIEHCGREPSGAFRHPQFKRFRPDKRAQDCIYYPEEQ